MVQTPLPELLDANRFVDSRLHISALLDPQHYNRFADIATLKAGGSINLRGYRESCGTKIFVGEIDCNAESVCQRCLQPVTYELSGKIAWALVHSEAAIKDVDPAMEPILVNDGPIVLRDLVEDELLLLLPIVSTHDDCDNEWRADLQSGDAAEKRNPFAVLATLLK